jgi:hypothetical protein
MSYTEININEIMDYNNYKEICDMFLALAKDDETKEKLESILYHGIYKDYYICSGNCIDNPMVEIKRRFSMAYLIVRNPESF